MDRNLREAINLLEDLEVAAKQGPIPASALRNVIALLEEHRGRLDQAMELLYGKDLFPSSSD